MVSQSSPDLCRVSVHADGVQADLALPAAVPVAALIPPIVAVLAGGDPPVDPQAGRYRLCRVGESALDPSMTLSQSTIRDGCMLVLTRSPCGPPAPRFDDVAEAVSMTLDSATPRWTPRAARLTAAVSACWLAGVGGLLLARGGFAVAAHRHLSTAFCAGAGCIALVAAVTAHRKDATAVLALGLMGAGFAGAAALSAVPGGPGAPNVLLGAMTAALASVLVLRVTGCGTVTFTAVACSSVIGALTALTGVLTGAPLRALGAICAVLSLGLLDAAGRMSIVTSGLSPRLGPAPDASPADTAAEPDRLCPRAFDADARLTALIAAFSATAAAGTVSTLAGVHAGGPRGPGFGLAMLIGAALLLRARSEAHRIRTAVLITSAVAVLTATLALWTVAWARSAPWIGATAAASAAAAFGLGFGTPAVSPLARRAAEVAEYAALVAAVPLACWTCGLYDVIRGLTL